MFTAGLYILTSKLNIFPQNLIKFGMSMRLEYRWYDYEIPKVDYLVQYEIPNKSKDDILLIESNIINITKSFECDENKIEWKIMNWNDLDKIIISYLQKNNIQFNRLIGDNIKKLKPMHNYDSNSSNRTKQLKKISGSKLTPLEYQKKIIKNLEIYFSKNDNGRLYLPCGTGKTFIGFWTFKNVLKYNSAFIVVPSLYLLSETYDSWQKELQYYDEKFHFILIGSDMEKKEQGYLNEFKPSTNIDEIKEQLTISNNIIAITTYQSSKLLLDSCKEMQFKFDLGIFDEAHRSVGEANKQFTHILSDKYRICEKKLFMTATEKIYNYTNNDVKKEDELKILSMDDKRIYGEEIYIYSLRQAITDGALVDYNIIAPYINNNEYKDIILNNDFIKSIKDNKIYNSELLSLSFMILYTMNKYKFTHLLIFCNKNKKAYELITVIKDIAKLFFGNDDNTYFNYLSGKNSMKVRKEEINKFKNSKRGIICSARIFNEGVNIKICDAVCFADNRESSVDIIQCVGRCLRRYKQNKVAYIIIPCYAEIQDNFFNNTNKNFKKIRLILNSLGSTDDMVSDRFELLSCNSTSSSIQGSINNEGKTKMINLERLKKTIISKIFDRTGDSNIVVKRILNRKNRDLFINGEELIDTKQKCKLFLRNKSFTLPKNVKNDNWVKWCLGDIIFEKIKTKYYTKTDLIQICHNMEIDDIQSYKINFVKDPKLPPPDYINGNGFYENFNLTEELDSTEDNFY